MSSHAILLRGVVGRELVGNDELQKANFKRCGPVFLSAIGVEDIQLVADLVFGTSMECLEGLEAITLVVKKPDESMIKPDESVMRIIIDECHIVFVTRKSAWMNWG